MQASHQTEDSGQTVKQFQGHHLTHKLMCLHAVAPALVFPEA